MEFQAIPVLRTFDEDKAKEFYLGSLGRKLDWQHQFEPGFPIYMQVSKGETDPFSNRVLFNEPAAPA
jgi:catechol 2,3-dioxygenase-like lactoylglutathione lyase family enzyme